MQRPRISHIVIALVGVLAVFYTPARFSLYTIFRLPLTFVKHALQIVVTLPRLPALSTENTTLRDTLLKRELELSRLKETLRHLNRGQQLLDALPVSSGKVARVIGRSMIPTQHTVLLDKGKNDGIQIDSVVTDVEGIVGRVWEVQSSTSLVTLLTDRESRIAGIVERSRETGLVIGKGYGQCEFIYLDAYADVKPGDRVLTAGLGGPFPKGLLIGTVTSVVRDEQTGSAKAQIKPTAQLGRLEEVLCLLPENQAVE